MNKVVFVIVRVLCAISLLACIGWWFENYVYADLAYADEMPVMEVNDKLYDPNAEEYGAICAMNGGEPELSGVTIEEYIDITNRWHGHRVIAAEKVMDLRYVEDYSYRTGLFTTTRAGHYEEVVIIRAVDDRGNIFTYYL